MQEVTQELRTMAHQYAVWREKNPVHWGKQTNYRRGGKRGLCGGGGRIFIRPE
jgi:hypothetical protein